MADDMDEDELILACSSPLMGDLSTQAFLEDLTSQDMFHHSLNPHNVTLTETRTFSRSISGQFASGYPNGVGDGMPNFSHQPSSPFAQPSSAFPQQPSPFPQSSFAQQGSPFPQQSHFPGPAFTQPSAYSTPKKDYPRMPPSNVPLTANVQQLVPANQNFNGEFEKFDVTFEVPPPGIKNPHIVYNKDTRTLHVLHNKCFCVYLGEPMNVPVGASIYAYLKFADDKNKNVIVSACDKHRDGSLFGRLVIRTNDEGAQPYTHADGTFMIRFPYPCNEQPSIGIEFACRNSEFKRAKFDLFFDLVVNGEIVQRRFLLKVSTNPNRDSTSQMKDRIRSCQTAFTAIPDSKRLHTLPMKTVEGSSSKREKPTQSCQPERVNDVYTIEVFGESSYHKLLEHAFLLARNTKYYEHKYGGTQLTTGLQTSQFDGHTSIDPWLESMKFMKYKQAFNNANIFTLDDLMNVYHNTFFESLGGIDAADAATLHCSFITWKNIHLWQLMKGGKE